LFIVEGFQRYRRLYRGDIHTPYSENDIIEQELMEEVNTVNSDDYSCMYVDKSLLFVDPYFQPCLYWQVAIFPCYGKYSPGHVYGDKVCRFTAVCFFGDSLVAENRC
jgi:hypothetical protein